MLCPSAQPREPGMGSHSGHNQTGFVRNMEIPAGWRMTRMVSNPRGCSRAFPENGGYRLLQLEARR